MLMACQAAIKPLLSKKTISYLNPNPIFSQFQRSRSFMDGLQQASEAFRPVFRTTERGFRRARWVTDLSALDQVCILYLKIVNAYNKMAK